MAPAQSTLRRSASSAPRHAHPSASTTSSRAQAASQVQGNAPESDDDPDDEYAPPAADDMEEDVDDNYPGDYNADDDDNGNNSEGEDEVDEDTRPSRTRRVSDKQAQLLEEQEQAKFRKHEKALKAVKAAKKKAGIVEKDTRGPIQDDVFTARTVTTTRPAATKSLAQRNSRVPAPAKFPSPDWHSSADQRTASTSQRTQDGSSTHTFRGRSPAPNRIPAREPIRNINGGIVPDSVSLQLYRHNGTEDNEQPLSPPPPRPQRPSPPRHHQRQPAPHHDSPPPSPPRSSSPSTGDKRARSEDSDDIRSTQSQRTSSSSGRPRAKDLDEVSKEYVGFAIRRYRSRLSTVCLYPELVQDGGFIKESWEEACTEFGTRLSLTPTIYKLCTIVVAVFPDVRGEMKTKVKPLTETIYGFRSGHDKKTIAFNRKRAEDLKEGSRFTMKDVKAKKGLFKNAILQKGCNTIWFANRRDEGPMAPDLFNPLTAPALAALITVTENTIDEYLTGIRTDVPFTANDYRTVYQTHLRALEQFATHTAKYNLLDTILLRMHNIARFHSGAQPIAQITTAVLSTEVLDAALKEFEEDSETETDGEQGEHSDTASF
ncbi:hypothetical protein C8R46DRAFT_1208276 [Mycena filopes]|nr:hypothetical protein C8R46DRAFT_1208276 [Mycena filopes]